MADQDPINPPKQRRRRRQTGRRSPTSPNMSRICRSRARTRRRFSSGRPSRSSTSSSTSTSTRSRDDVHEVILKIDVAARRTMAPISSSISATPACSASATSRKKRFRPFLLVEAPRLLFPFARQIIAEAVQNPGFPPLLLDPIDFGAAYMAQLQAQQSGRAERRRAPEATAEQAPPATADSERLEPMNLLQGDRHDRRADDGQPRARLRARHDRFAGARRRATPTTPSTSPSCCPTSSAGCSAKAPSRQGFVPLFSRRLRGRAGMRTRRPSPTKSWRCSCRPCCWSPSSSKSSCRRSCWLVAGDYAERPGQVRARGRADPLDLPLSDLHQPGGLLSGVLNSLTRFAVAAFAPALLNIALIVALLVAPPATSRRRCAAWRSRCSSAASSSSPCAGSAVRRAGVKLHFGRPRMTPAVKELRRPDPAGDRGGGRLSDQPAVLRLFLRQPRRGRAGQSELCRPPQPAAAVDHRHGARHRHPAGDQPGHRPRRRCTRRPTSRPAPSTCRCC